MTSPTIGRCSSCRRLRPLDELLELRDRVTGARRTVCRPLLDDRPGDGCFRRLSQSAGREDVRLASEVLA